MRMLAQIALKNILFATNFDVASGRAWPFAIALRHRYEANLFIAHVVPEEAYIYARPEVLRQIEKETNSYASEALDKLARLIRRKGGVCETVLEKGNVPSVLSELVRQYLIDLAIIGTGSRDGMEKLMLGSVAEAFIRDAGCPVLTVGPSVGIEQDEGMQTIICATDFSVESLRAATTAMSLAEEYDARIIALHVVEENSADSGLKLKLRVEECFRELSGPYADLRLAPQVIVQHGNPAECIVRVSAGLAASMIAMGVRGVGALGHVASHFGSVAHKVLCHAECPVLSAGAPGTAKEKIADEGV